MSSYIEFKLDEDMEVQIDNKQEVLLAGVIQGFAGRSAIQFIEKAHKSGMTVTIIDGDGELPEGVYHD